VAVAVSGWDYFRVQALEAAIVLTALYCSHVLDLIEDFRRRWKHFAPRRRRFCRTLCAVWRTLVAVCVREDGS
jgi:hypothetical protein